MSPESQILDRETSSLFWMNVLEIWVATFFYGAYCILFGRCLYILLNRMRQLERQGILLAPVITLFALSTGQIIVLTIQSAIVVGHSNLAIDKILTASVLIYVSSCVCSDALLIYRCYVIWNENQYMIAAPLILLVTATVFGYLQNLTVFRILSLLTTVSVTFLTVSRIAWAAFQRRGQLTGELQKKYVTATSTMFESGALYTICVAVHFALFSRGSVATPIVFSAVSQIVVSLLLIELGSTENEGLHRELHRPSSLSESGWKRK
ncbi:hypothetical protein DFH09DRAFT_1171496 [Mycena vulgaris]|nr:hypothetical protein DFH09DRAFT_1171496 [Mycena vulgaris]